MANKGFQTIPGTIDITNNYSDFISKPQVEWTGSNWRNKKNMQITHGDTSFPQDTDSSFAGLNRQANLYKDTNGADGLKLTATAGQAHSANYEMYGDGRWMPARIFNGIGFRCYQSSGSKHAMYLKKYGLIFAHRTGGSYRIWGFNTGATNPSEGNRDQRILSSSSEVATIRTWGPDWLFQGIVINIACNGGTGSDYSELQIFNMKVGSKMSTLGGQYRMLPAGKRGYDKRNAHVGTVGFTNLFAT